MGAIVAAILGALAGLGGTIYSEVKSKEANKKKLGVLASRVSTQLGEAERLDATEGDFLKTALGKGYMEKLKNEYRDALKETTQSGLKTGQSDEAKIAGRESAAGQYAKGLSRLAQVGTQYRGQILGQGMRLRELASKGQYDYDMANLDSRKQQAANVAAGMQSAGAAISSIGGAISGTGEEKKQKKQKSTGEGGIVPPTTDPNQIYDYYEELLNENENKVLLS